jgi:hypothetical protein
MGINDQGPKEQMEEYEIRKDVGIREFSSFLYGYSMTMEYNDKPRIRKICNEAVGNSGNTRKRQELCVPFLQFLLIKSKEVVLFNLALSHLEYSVLICRINYARYKIRKGPDPLTLYILHILGPH